MVLLLELSMLIPRIAIIDPVGAQVLVEKPDGRVVGIDDMVVMMIPFCLYQIIELMIKEFWRNWCNCNCPIFNGQIINVRLLELDIGTHQQSLFNPPEAKCSAEVGFKWIQ